MVSHKAFSSVINTKNQVVKSMDLIKPKAEKVTDLTFNPNSHNKLFQNSVTLNNHIHR